MSWLARLFPPRRPDAPTAAAGAAPPPKASPPAPAAVPSGEAALPLGWLLDAGVGIDAAVVTPAERLALDAIDRIFALPSLPDELLPRAAALIPQLLAALRQSDLPVPVLAQRVAKDIVLSAEVLRLASSPYYRAQGAVTGLEQAIALIGESGLHTVIARVVLKPLYESVPGPLSARAAMRLWQHADALAGETALAARAAGLPAFDGYLAGLLHDAGWTVLLRVLDRAGIEPTMPATTAFEAKCDQRAHRLFGRAAQRWSITPGFSGLGADALTRALAASTLPLALALQQARAVCGATLRAPARGAGSSSAAAPAAEGARP